MYTCKKRKQKNLLHFLKHFDVKVPFCLVVAEVEVLGMAGEHYLSSPLSCPVSVHSQAYTIALWAGVPHLLVSLKGQCTGECLSLSAGLASSRNLLSLQVLWDSAMSSFKPQALHHLTLHHNGYAGSLASEHVWIPDAFHTHEAEGVFGEGCFL